MIEGKIVTSYRGSLLFDAEGSMSLNDLYLPIKEGRRHFLSVGHVGVKTAPDDETEQVEVWVQDVEMVHWSGHRTWCYKTMSLLEDELTEVWSIDFSKEFLKEGYQVAVVSESHPWQAIDNRLIEVVINSERVYG